MNLLVVSQYFHPEKFRINDLVTELVARGHRVTVLTGLPNYPSGTFHDGYGYFGAKEEVVFGAKVVRVLLIPRGSGSGARLFLNYLSFMIFASFAVLFRLKGPFDAIFVFEPSPITVGVPAMVARLRFRAPILFWVLDLWPESLTAVGRVKSRRVLAALDRLVRMIYRSCALVLVSSRAFAANVVEHDGHADAVRYFPNWVEPEYNAGLDADLPALPSGVRIVFAGNMGAAQDIPTILSAAEAARDLEDVNWIFAGDGRLAKWARDEVARRGLSSRVHFLGQLPATKMYALFQEADALLISLRSDPLFDKTVPGKLQSYLAAGRPVLAMLDGEGAQIVAEAGAGWVCAAGDAGGLVANVRALTGASVETRNRMGEAGRAYAKEHFDRKMLMDQLEDWLRDAVDNGKATRE
jgi:glycosyltransferase involved in cell wall biosynthesis